VELGVAVARGPVHEDDRHHAGSGADDCRRHVRLLQNVRRQGSTMRCGHVGKQCPRKAPVIVPSQCTLREAASLMRTHGVGALLVLRGDELVGIVTDRDLAGAPEITACSKGLSSLPTRRTQWKSNQLTFQAEFVVGIDGSPASLEALEWAIRFTVATTLALEVVAAWDWPISLSLAPIAPNFAPEMSAEQMLDRMILQKRAEHPDLLIEGRVVQGDAAAVLEDASKGAALLVVSTRGHGEIVGLLLGSVSEHCVTHAHCPVVVYRSDSGDASSDTSPSLTGQVRT
jgi:nucleotide-binding universal stress UspA family protein